MTYVFDGKSTPLVDISSMAPAEEILARCDALGKISSEPWRLTRAYLTPEHKRANEQVAAWMEEAGLKTRVDGVGNVIGRWEGENPDEPVLMIGSHLDTVRNAGKYDGILGVLLPLSVMKIMKQSGVRPPFSIDLVGFAEEEGSRFESTLIGSRGITGRLDPGVLEVADPDGTTVAEALNDFGLYPNLIHEAAYPEGAVRAFLEVHIEQGPVLEKHDLPVGIVTGIAGATRWRCAVTGVAGHAGTLPMAQRLDAMCGAAEMVLAVEEVFTGGANRVGTVGLVETRPGSVNVVPRLARFTVDARSAEDEDRKEGLTVLRKKFAEIVERRGLHLDISESHDSPAMACDPKLMDVWERAVVAEGVQPLRLLSGAGHDAMELAEIAPSAMLFVRSPKGISHNPEESVIPEDVNVASRVMARVLADMFAHG